MYYIFVERSRNNNTNKFIRKILLKGCLTMQSKKIFISHSSVDQDFASWVSRLLVCLGVDQDVIFYSSNFRQGVRQHISGEVRQALMETSLDIIILSNQYKQSEYCISEAGVIWFKNQALKSEMIIITLPSVSGQLDVGFINYDYNQYRLLSEHFFDSLCERLKEVLSRHKLCQNQIDAPLYISLVQELDDYKHSLPIIENLSIPFSNQEQIRMDLKKAWESIQTVSWRSPNVLNTSNSVFYKSYCRRIQLYIPDSLEKPGEITVKTSTECVIVNLSNQDYEDIYSSQFLKKGGGHATFQENFQVDGAIVKQPTNPARDNLFMDSPYIVNKGPIIIVSAHSCAKIQFVTSYNIEPERFFQSKILRIPCAEYIVDAVLDESIKNHLGRSYILRSQFIPPNPHNLRNGTVPTTQLVDIPNKQYIHFECCNGFPAGGGYALALSKR